MVKIEKEKCISCTACLSACPYGSIEMTGLFFEVVDESNCNNCEKKSCIVLCPTGAISLE